MIIDENSTAVEQKKKMKNSKENMRKSEDWSRRSIIPIKGIWERKEKSERNNQQPHSRKSPKKAFPDWKGTPSIQHPEWKEIHIRNPHC